MSSVEANVLWNNVNTRGIPEEVYFVKCEPGAGGQYSCNLDDEGPLAGPFPRSSENPNNGNIILEPNSDYTCYILAKNKYGSSCSRNWLDVITPYDDRWSLFPLKKKALGIATMTHVSREKDIP